MGRSLRAVVLILILVGCGGGSPDALPVGFVNQTQHSDSELWAIWKAAQQNLAKQIDLNPLQRSFQNAPADVRPGDPRALQVVPHQLRVAGQPDVSSRVLLAATGVYRSDPTGMIACPQPCNVHYATAYSLYQRQLTRYAASWEFQGDNFAFILQYEFENQILNALGYSMQWR
jgi:hypothetical protein